MVKEDIVGGLNAKAKLIRREIVTMISIAGSGHPGGSLSATDLIVALYFNKLRYDPEKPDWEDRDRVVFSKGHAAPLLYACLAECGYFSKEELWNLRKIGHMLQGHPSKIKTPGVEASTGPLGQGLSVATGIALAGKIDKKDYCVYALVGDGELQEGAIWEAVMSAAHFKLDNLCAVVDCNRLQIDGFTKDIMNVDPVADKFRAFNWNVIEIEGHDMKQIVEAYDQFEKFSGKPTAIIAKTVKGKGVSFMENQAGWHGKAPSKEEFERAIKELV